eukprot:115925-Amphidinium_carterae.2
MSQSVDLHGIQNCLPQKWTLKNEINVSIIYTERMAESPASNSFDVLWSCTRLLTSDLPHAAAEHFYWYGNHWKVLRK